MPNLLSTENGGQQELDSGLQSPESVSAGPTEGGLGAGFSGNINGVGFSFGGGLGSGPGTRPLALHTEYVEGEAEWEKPYGSGTDVVFYLMRADQE